MPTGQIANRTKCQPDKMPTKGWHIVRTFFCGWHLVRPNFWLAFCPEHLNMFWPFVQIIKMSSCLKYQRSGSLDTMGPLGWFDEF